VSAERERADSKADGGRRIAPAPPRYTLREVLKGVTPQAMREALDWGPDKGREIVE
jgi:antitoxin MazE